MSADVSTAGLIAAAVESVDKVGPCTARFTLLGINDVRADRRNIIVEALATFALPSGGLYPTAVSPRQWEHAFSHESVREWYEKIGSILRAPDRILRRHVIAVDETKLKLQGQFVFVWSAVDIRRYEVPLLKASFTRGESSR